MESRAGWVDTAKAIGIILVVYGHVARGLYNAGFELPLAYYRLADSIIYSFHMPLFFFLSGLLFYHSFSGKGGRKLVFSKIDTILYPYIVWSLIQGLIEVVLADYTNGNISLNDVITLWDPRAQFWFLYTLFCIFIIVSILYSIFSKHFGPIFFLLSILLYLFPTILPDLGISSFLSQNLVFFFFGIMFSAYAKINFLTTKLCLTLAALLFVIAQWIYHGYLSLEYRDKGFESLLLAFISIFFILALSNLLSRSKLHFLETLGSASMAIYLMHILCSSGIRIILNKFLGIDSVIIHLAFGCLVGIFFPLVAVEVIKKLGLTFILTAPISSYIARRHKSLFSTLKP